MHQHFGCCVTQNQIVEQLREIGTDISAATVNNILISGHDNFHQEKDDVLTTGLRVSPYVNVDDTGARHQGKNAYCTHIGSPFFAWFKTTFSKSRINFLTLLRASFKDYILTSVRDKKAEKRTQIGLVRFYEDQTKTQKESLCQI